MKFRLSLPVIVVFLSLFLCQPVLASRALVKKAKDLDHTSGKLGTYKALIIGIDQYDDPNIPDLKTAIRDAKAMAEVLQESYGFETRLLLNGQVTREKLYNNLRKLASDSKPEDSILIYYAGHGDLNRQYNDGWWIPADARGGNPATYFDNVQIQKAMRSMAARHVLLISDSCYSGSLFGSSRSVPPVIDEKYYLRLYNEKSRWGITSGNKEPVEDSGTDGHSIFAYQLLKELRRDGKKVFSTQELYTRIAPIIGNNSDQTPLCRPIRNTGDQGGEFIFVRTAGGESLSDVGKQKAVVDNDMGSLQVKSSPSGARVFIDSKRAGETPVELGNMKPGSKRVRVEKTGYILEEKSVEIRAGGRKLIRFNLETENGMAWLTVSTTPSSARVRILNISPRYTSGMELVPGRYHVEVSFKGYLSKKQWVDLAAGDDLDIDISLKREKLKAVAASGGTFTDPFTGMEFVYVKGGCYQMGDTFGDGDSDEKPVHEVCLDSFYMGKYEVTQGEYKKIVGSNPSHFPTLFDNGDNFPVEKVSWDDTQFFIRALNSHSGKSYRLPTEAEWEYAARERGRRVRFGTGKDTIGSDEANFNAKANYKQSYSRSGTYRKQTTEVGSFASNSLGLHDMSGNVWEWCSDWYGEKYYSLSSRNNPQGESSGARRVFRGGGWGHIPGDVRVVIRNGSGPGDRSFLLGFRLVFPEGNSQAGQSGADSSFVKI